MSSKVPTKFKIAHKCGHSPLVDLGPKGKYAKPAAKRAAFVQWANKAWSDPESGRDCWDCYKQTTKVDRHQLLLDAEAFEEKYQLPSFTGTEKQLASEKLIAGVTLARYFVLQSLFENPEDEAKQQHAQLLDAARAVSYAGFWANELSYGTIKDHDYGQPEFIELLLSAHEAEQERAERKESGEYIETENPFE